MLRLLNLRHTYTASGLEARTVLDIPAWSLNRGGQVLLRGVSGSGKTTLFNVVAGLLRPSMGEVCLEDVALYKLSEPARDRLRAAKIGYVFQNHHLMPGFTALENVVMPMMFAGTIPAFKRNSRALELLTAVGLADYAQHRPNQLSTGQRLRVGIARALANQPVLVLADEPTAALDPASSESIMDFLQDSCRKTDASMIVASHDPALVARFPHTIDLRAGHLGAEKKVNS